VTTQKRDRIAQIKRSENEINRRNTGSWLLLKWLPMIFISWYSWPVYSSLLECVLDLVTFFQ